MLKNIDKTEKRKEYTMPDKSKKDVNIVEERVVAKESIKQQRKRYDELRKTMTATAARVEFLRTLLEMGNSKREAARMLSKVDASLSSSSAETIVYTNFSGVYQTSRQGERKIVRANTLVISVPKDIGDDEGLL